MDLRRSAATLGLVGAISFAPACSDSAASPDSHTDAGHADAAVVDGAVECPDALMPFIPMSAVPQGRPCQVDTATCTFAADGVCGDADNPSISNGWECVCEDSKWDCVITSQGGGVCAPDAS